MERAVIAAGLAVLLVAAQAAEDRDRKGNVPYYLSLLNRWGKPPDAAQRFYEAAFKALAAKPDAVYADLATDADVRRLCETQNVRHLGGPMLGAVTPHGASVWLRTLRPAKVEVLVTVGATEKRYGPVESAVETDLTAVVPVTGLEPGARYPYRVLVNGEAIAIPDQASITTAPDDTRPATVRIAFGTCPHVWGLGNRRQSDLIRSRHPAAMLLYGDVSVQDNGKHRGLARCGYLVREGYPAWRDLVASVPVYVTWDDHDYLGNDLWGVPSGYTKEDQMRTWEVFRRSWNNPSYGFGDERRGVFFRTRIGPCDVIMTDGRYFRRKGALLDDDQMKWLEAQLLDCQGPFIVLSSGTMWSDYVDSGKDSWGKFDPQGRERIFSLIEKHRIPGVLLISGDRHGASGWRIPRPSGFTFYEFEPASLGGRAGPGGKTVGPKDVQLFHLNSEYAFGEFTIDATVPDPTVAFRLIREDGTVFYELTLKRSQLTPPVPAVTTKP